MIAYKFLSRGAVGPFSGFRWPMPAAGSPGPWVDAAAGAPPRGIHACRAADLPYWIEDELWVAELDGDVERREHQLVAPRGRLLSAVDGWSDLARDFAAECAGALRGRVAAALAAGRAGPGGAGLLRGYVADAEACAASGNVAGAAYVAAHASVALAGDASAFAAERRRQAAWLAERLVASAR